MSRNALGIVPPTLLTTVSSRPKASYAASARPATASRSLQVGGYDVRPAAGGAHPLGDQLELDLGARGHHDVGPGLGERDRGGRADAAPGPGDDGDVVGEGEPVEDAHDETSPRPVTSGRSSAVTSPPGAATTAGTAFTNR